MAMPTPAVRSLLLVRNGVDHDARVRRAARVAAQVLEGTALVVGVATPTAPAGATIVEGVPVLRLPARPTGLTVLGLALEGIWTSLRQISRAPAAPELSPAAPQTEPAAANGAGPANDAAPVTAEGAGPVTANRAGPVAANGAGPVTADGAGPVTADGAGPATADGAGPATANGGGRLDANGAGPAVHVNGARPIEANGAKPVAVNGCRAPAANGADRTHANGRGGAIATNRPNPATRTAVASAPGLTLAGRTRRILSGLSYTRQALAVAHQTRPTLVHANDWNTMWTGLAIKVRHRARLVYDSHELWPDRHGRWEWRPWLLAGEALFVRAADEVVTSSSGYADTLAARYRIRHPTVVRNIPERPASTGQASSDGLTPSGVAGERVPPRPPRVVYVGGLMPGRGLEQMIDALPLLPDVRLCAIGPGSPRYRTGLLTRAAAMGVADRVVLRAPVAPGAVQGALAGAAAGLCLIQPICRSYELCLPNKLFEYAAAGVPVLASDMPVIAAVVRGNGLGEVVAADAPRAIAAGLRRLLVPGGWALTASRVRAFADAHDWPGEAGGLAEAYRRAASGVAS